MDSTLRIFLKTNSSSWIRKFSTSGSRWVFESKWWFFYIKQPICHLDQDLRENGRFGWKNENPCFENFSGVPGHKLSLGEVEDSQGFLEVKHSKYKNGVFTMHSLDQYIFVSIFKFRIKLTKAKIMQFVDFGRQPN